jgi:hypothetical protein
VSTYVWGLSRSTAPAAARRRRRRRSLAPAFRALAAGAGHALRLVALSGRYLPGLAGAGVLSFGAWLAWAPAGFVVAGLLLLALDRRLRP